MFRFILQAIGIFFLIRFVTGFVIPVVRTTLQIRKGFKTAREQMEETARRQQQQASAEQQAAPKRPSSSDAGDYLDFEEVK
jgi:Sec-independent protein translocase protein TatA